MTWPPLDDAAAAARQATAPRVEPRTAKTFTTTLPTFVGPGLVTGLSPVPSLSDLPLARQAG